jgi:hypothetical protein
MRGLGGWNENSTIMLIFRMMTPSANRSHPPTNATSPPTIAAETAAVNPNTIIDGPMMSTNQSNPKPNVV